MGLIDRMFAVAEPPPAAKAETGIGAVWMAEGVPLDDLRRNPSKLMRQAQEIGRTNPIIRSAERTVSGSLATVAWHLETDDGEHVTDESPESLRAVRDLLARPFTPRPNEPRPSTPTTQTALWQVTSRHMGLCGVGAWFLDQINALSGFPLQLLAVNPARLTPRTDGNGNLVGWWLDKGVNGKPGTPLEREEILLFNLEPPDWGHFGPGLVEAAMTKVQLLRFGDRHATQTFAAGGRLGGMFSPKGENATIQPDAFKTLVRDVRNIADSPDASKRTLVLQGPMEFSRTAATLDELQLPDLTVLSRDDLLALWGVPLTQVGRVVPAGMGADTRDFDEAVLWQKAILPRLRVIRDTIQLELLDRLIPQGISVRLVIEEPTFDDRAPQFEMASKARELPLRNRERRDLIGLPPLGIPEIDDAIWMPVQIVETTVAPEGKARPIPGVQQVRARAAAAMQRDVAKFLRDQKSEIARRVRAHAEHIARKPKDTSVWFDQDRWDRELTAVLRPHAAGAIDAVSGTVAAKLRPGKAEISDAVMSRLLRSVGIRIRGINETTRDLIADLISKGLDEGVSPAELGDRIEDATAFNEYRSELIARTETMHVMNTASLETMREFDVEYAEAIDGDEDKECAERNGRRYRLDEALAIVDHPNGTLDWVPVI